MIDCEIKMKNKRILLHHFMLYYKETDVYKVKLLFYIDLLGGTQMGYQYNRLWKILIDKEMNKVELRDAAGITSATLAKLGKNQNVSMEVLGRICKVLECDIGDIVEYLNDTKEEHLFE